MKNWRYFGRNVLIALKKNWRNYGKKALVIMKWTAVFFFASTLFVEVLFTFINPPITPLMINRVIEQKLDGKKAKLHKKWMPIEKISPNMYQAVVASEDNRFLEHWGIDVQAIEKAVQYNKRHRTETWCQHNYTAGSQKCFSMAGQDMAAQRI